MAAIGFAKPDFNEPYKTDIGVEFINKLSDSAPTGSTGYSLYDLITDFYKLKQDFPTDKDKYQINIMKAFELGTREAELIKDAYERTKTRRRKAHRF